MFYVGETLYCGVGDREWGKQELTILRTSKNIDTLEITPIYRTVADLDWKCEGSDISRTSENFLTLAITRYIGESGVFNAEDRN